MKSAICSAIVVCVLPVLVPPVPLVVVPLVPVVLDEPEPCGDLKMLAPGAPEPSEPPQAAVISVTDAQSVAPIKVRVPRESAMLSSTFSRSKEKYRAPPPRTRRHTECRPPAIAADRLDRAWRTRRHALKEKP
ncbi:hypothetical protein [Burkholderia pseudomallei]|uniref:hypothetical protein n=1 Tax=Burkholderia pseudomallei TaxID=28450 RepID=UPI001F3D6E52|nr:hypothetical protein [Burkholderia pseudomallei]